MDQRRLYAASALLATFLGLQALTGPAQAQEVELRFSPLQQVVQVGELVEIQLLAFASGVTSLEFSAIDAILDWTPEHLLLLGVDDAAASMSWLVSSFLLDPDGINASLSDGDALYTALVQPETPGVAPPGGAVITTLQFVALTPTAGTVLSLTPTLGDFGVTAVYAYSTPGLAITGDISGTATVQIVAPPTAYCFGAPTDCPCGNVGAPGEGCANSTGAGGLLQASGSASVAADSLVLTATQMAPNQFGLFIVGGAAQSNITLGDGLRCVAPGATGLHRFAPIVNGGPGSTMTLGPGIVAYSQANFPAVGIIQPGVTYQFQAWYRDPVGGPCGTGFNLTNGMQVTFTP